jgi:hypothetical protein
LLRPKADIHSFSKFPTDLITACAKALAASLHWLISPREPKLDVCFWHKADIQLSFGNVFGGKADIATTNEMSVVDP